MSNQIIGRYLKEHKLDAIVLFNKDPNFKYFVKQELEHGLMFLSGKNSTLFISPLYSPRLDGFKLVHWEKFEADLKKFIRRNKIRQVGVDVQNLLVREKMFLKKHLRMKDVTNFLSEIRCCKDPEEIRRTREACRITDSIFTKIISGLKRKRFRTEKDIALFMRMEALKQEAEMAFDPIVASGGNGVVAHHEPDSKLKRGFMILDFGAKYKGYCSDMTRTIYLGTPSRKEKELYAKVLAIQESCIEMAKPGIKAAKLHEHSLRMFGKDAKYFNHSLGHGTGVEIHELPNVSIRSKDVLKRGNIFTIEPGYYNQQTGIGIRIEDDILLGAKKEVLTRSTKELVCVNFS
ncbi:MAG: Xaa-Pro peptidase family protein [archaeon]